jgi:hypothetical protein
MTPDEKRAHKATLRADRRKREERKKVEDKIRRLFCSGFATLAAVASD